MFEEVVVIVASLVGFAMLLSVIINILKVVGVVKEDTAQLWVTGGNLLLTLVVYGFRIFKPEFDFTTLDPMAQEIATIGTFILTFVLQILGSKVTHFAVRGTPVIGKSFSYDREHQNK